MGVELCGQKLTWDDVRPFKVQFKQLDVSKTHRLSKQDLDAYCSKQESAKKRRDAHMEAAKANRKRGFFSKKEPAPAQKSMQAHMAAEEVAAVKVQAIFRGRNARRESSRGVPTGAASWAGDLPVAGGVAPIGVAPRIGSRKVVPE